jgi:hypothetical protein
MPAGRFRAGRLIELLWADDPPAAVAASLQTYVAGLRRALEPGRAARTPATIVVTSTLGYSLKLADDALDVGEFAATIDAVHRRLSRRARRAAPARATWTSARFGACVMRYSGCWAAGEGNRLPSWGITIRCWRNGPG